MNLLDKQYLELLQDILNNGIEKSDRTGTGTLSVFGRTIRHNMKYGFPLITTKKIAWKTMVTELLWFLHGDTNIKYLVDNGCHIWDGDAYNNFYKKSLEIKLAYESGDLLGTQPHIENIFSNPDELIILSKKQFIDKIKNDNEFSNRFGDLGPIYGKQWRRWERKATREEKIVEPEKYTKYIDQIQNLINDLKTNPDSRRLMVNSWQVGEISKMVLPPCHYGFQVYTKELNLDARIDYYNSLKDPLNKSSDYHDEHMDSLGVPKRSISLMFNMRSNDVPLGLPFNIASYGLLLEIIAKLVNMVPDELIANLGDAHIYKNQIDGIKEQLGREPFQLPKLIFSTQIDFEKGINELLDSCLITDFQVEGYKSHPAIKIPLSN